MGQSPRLAEADRVGTSRQARTKILNTLVEILRDAASDAGSTPAASTNPSLPFRLPSLKTELIARIVGVPEAIWRSWKPAYPIRRREEESRNQDLYPLGFGMQIPVTLVAVDEMHEWTVEHRLPAGKLVIRHHISPLTAGSVEVQKTIEVHGPLTVVYGLLMPGIRRQWRREVTALQRGISPQGR